MRWQVIYYVKVNIEMYIYIWVLAFNKTYYEFDYQNLTLILNGSQNIMSYNFVKNGLMSRIPVLRIVEDYGQEAFGLIEWNIWRRLDRMHGAYSDS